MKNSTTGNPPYGEVNASSGWWNAYNEKVNIIFNFSEKPGYFRTLKMRYLLHNPEDLHAHLILPPSLLQRQYLKESVNLVALYCTGGPKASEGIPKEVSKAS